MKKTLTMLGAGACVLLALNSCQNTNDFSDEEAMMMSQATVGDDQLPPWLLEDDGANQIAADSRTNHPIPEPGEMLADSGSSASSSQIQPNLAGHSDDIIEDAPENAVISPDESLAGTGTPGSGATTVKPHSTQPIASTNKPGKTTTKTTKPGKKNQKKKVMRVTEPTLITYKVRKGDSLSLIAQRSGTTVAAIRKASGIKGDTIYAGSTIKVPYTPKGYKAPADGGSSSKPRKHTVRRGETVSGIAARYGVTTSQVLKANGLTMNTASRIRVGQTLTIPAKATQTKKSGKSKRRSRR